MRMSSMDPGELHFGHASQRLGPNTLRMPFHGRNAGSHAIRRKVMLLHRPLQEFDCVIQVFEVSCSVWLDLHSGQHGHHTAHRADGWF